MSTTLPVAQPVGGDDAALGPSDSTAVLEHLLSGRQLDPALRERVRNRAAQVTADIQREHGLVDDVTFQALLDDES